MRTGIILLALLVTLQALAEDATLTWAPPAEQESCTPAGPVVGLAGFRIYKLVEDITDPTVTSLVVPNLKPGTHYFVATSYNDQGEESRASGTAEKVTTAFDTIDTTAYYAIQQSDKFILLPIGTVPLGVACDATQEVNGHNAVADRNDVTWTGTARPLVVVVKCG